ncbi:hypothetical protein, partial [Microcystis aeruginosa]|uniref:hypothetical protein n=1 Tax=Microcystis aeruginosa TaxID=1126 RepID=UPI000A562A5D
AIQGGIPIAIGRASFASASISSFANSMLMGGVHITKGNEPYTMTMRTVKGIGGNFSRTTTGALAFGAVSGGAGARLAGGNFWQGAVTGLFVTGFNHLMHSVIDGDGDGGGDPKTKKYKGSLKSSYGEKVYTLEEWYRAYADSSYFEITTDAGYKQGLPAGPKMRYVRNPIDGNVMDMRHVTVIGYNMLEFLGDAVEIIQYGTGDYSNSAYNIQDYYSNKIGSYFYEMRNSGS